MEEINSVLLGIVVLFFGILILKNILKLKKICVICVSIILMWLILLTLCLVDLFDNKIIIAILMGHTSLGIFYALEKKVGEEFKVFRLPTLLSLILIIYSILESFNTTGWILVLALWGIFFVIYLSRKRNLKSVFDEILECCKKW
ncbi:MAG: hypothetical protein KKC19_00900 [Nanoarchaeota archaeon]|nr:hypothetical protein [Nanoarchaeota archaeon]